MNYFFDWLSQFIVLFFCHRKLQLFLLQHFFKQEDLKFRWPLLIFSFQNVFNVFLWRFSFNDIRIFCKRWSRFLFFILIFTIILAHTLIFTFDGFLWNFRLFSWDFLFDFQIFFVLLGFDCWNIFLIILTFDIVILWSFNRPMTNSYIYFESSLWRSKNIWRVSRGLSFDFYGSNSTYNLNSSCPAYYEKFIVFVPIFLI